MAKLFGIFSKKKSNSTIREEIAKEVVSDWLYEITSQDSKLPIFAVCKLRDDNLTVYTNFPGYMIGYHGERCKPFVDTLKNIGIKVQLKDTPTRRVTMI